MDKLAELEKELLEDMEENPVEYKGTVSNVFEIDSNLRTINIPVTVKNVGVENDDDVKRLEFTMPKQYGEFDLSQFRIRINYINANGDKSIYLVEDKKVSGENITFSWLVGRNVTKYKGQVNFIVCLKLSDEKGKVLKELNTTLCRLEVLEGLEVVPFVDDKTIDMIEQLLRIVETETTGAVQKVTEEGNKQVKEVQKAAQEIAADREQIQKNAESVTALKEDLKPLNDDIYPKIIPTWTHGGISGTTGEEWGDTVLKYARTDSIKIVHTFVEVPTDFIFLVHYYNPTGWIGSSTPQKNYFDISSLSFYKTASYFRVSVESKNDIILSNLNNVVRIQDVVKSYKKRIEKLEMDTEFNKNYTFEKVILNATAPPSTIHVEHDIDARYKYAICPTKLFKGRSILMYAFVNGEYKRINAVNVNTGKKVNAIYQIGEYMLLGTENATKIKISSDFTCNASKTVTVSLKKYATTPYVPCEVKTTKYIPNYDKTEETVNLPYCFGTYNGYAYGISGTEIKRANLITKEIETFYTTGGKISSAMIFENGNIVFVRSDDYYSYLLKEGEVTRIHKFYDITNSMPLLPNKLFSMKATNNIGIISEYSGSKTPISGYKAYITKDYGVTWDILFDLEKLIDEPNLREYHLHSIVYDKFGDMYWACSGDETNIDMIWYSLDGVKWNKANNLITSKVTTIIPMRDCVIFISDTEFVNTFKWERTLLNNGDKIYFDLVSEKVKLWPSPCPIGCNGAYDEKNNVSYYGYFVDADINNAYKADHPIKYGVIYGTDGVRDIEVYTPNNIGGIIGIFCEDKKIIAAKTGNIYIFNK